jgi:hypothetical protein
LHLTSPQRNAQQSPIADLAIGLAVGRRDDRPLRPGPPLQFQNIALSYGDRFRPDNLTPFLASGASGL